MLAALQTRSDVVQQTQPVRSCPPGNSAGSSSKGKVLISVSDKQHLEHLAKVDAQACPAGCNKPECCNRPVPSTQTWLFHRGYVSKAMSWCLLEAVPLPLKRLACRCSGWSNLQALQKCLMVIPSTCSSLQYMQHLDDSYLGTILYRDCLQHGKSSNYTDCVQAV